MKKFIDWEEVEKQKINADEACECTRSKIQNIINMFKGDFKDTEEQEGCSSNACCTKSDEK